MTMQPSELREAIAALGISAEGFARCLGVTGRAVRLWEAGHRPIPPTVERLVSIVLACEPARHLFIAGEKPQFESFYIEGGRQ